MLLWNDCDTNEVPDGEFFASSTVVAPCVAKPAGRDWIVKALFGARQTLTVLLAVAGTDVAIVVVAARDTVVGVAPDGLFAADDEQAAGTIAARASST